MAFEKDRFRMKKSESLIKPQGHSSKEKLTKENESPLEPNTKKEKFAKKMISDTVQKGVEEYKNQLARDDAGVEVTTRYIEGTIKGTHYAAKTLKEQQLKKELKEQQLKKELKEQQLKKELKEQKDDLKLVKQAQSQNSFVRKLYKQPMNIVSTGTAKYSEKLKTDDQGVEVVVEGTTLIKKSAKELKRAHDLLKHKKNQEKLAYITTKLSEQKTKLNVQKSEKVVHLHDIEKNKLQKRIIKKRMYAAHYEKNAATRLASTVTSAQKKAAEKAKAAFAAFKETISRKIAIGSGVFVSLLLPIAIIFLLLFGVAIFISMGGGIEEEIYGDIGTAVNLSPEVERWRELVTNEAKKQGMLPYVDLILAIIQVETGGTGTPDIMQSSESAGLPRNSFKTPEESVRQGIKYLKEIIKILKYYELGYENNAKLIAQTYNFGVPFAHYIGKRQLNYDINVTETYSRDVLAPALGNKTGETYSYVNAVSQRLGKTYLYRNGGNFLYGEMVGQYLVRNAAIYAGDFGVIMQEILKYEGNPYVWGGNSPSTGFDCSGLVQWGYKQIGINLPRTAEEQFRVTVEVNPKDAQPGDLIFFKGTYGGPDHISHVGFYIDSKLMYDSNGRGVGYTNWNSSYWKNHFHSIRRVIR